MTEPIDNRIEGESVGTENVLVRHEIDVVTRPHWIDKRSGEILHDSEVCRLDGRQLVAYQEYAIKYSPLEALAAFLATYQLEVHSRRSKSEHCWMLASRGQGSK